MRGGTIGHGGSWTGHGGPSGCGGIGATGYCIITDSEDNKRRHWQK